MERRRLIILTAGGLSVLVAGGLALAQVARTARPTPVETTLAPSRADSAALAQARQSPLAARLQTVLANDQAAVAVLRQIEASDVPVIGPPDPALLRTARFYPGERQYTLVVRPPGQIVEIFGSTRAFRPPEGVTLPRPQQPASPPPVATRVIRQTPLAAARAEGQTRGLGDIRTERTEYGVDVSFSRFGAVYNVSFICDDRASLECSDAAAVQFANRLELIGGGQ
ncbi:MAG: hypothetical protein Q8S03_15620 [Brevundimonas sp.]|uniref:hypothetical protein n=1 Tax=Brevundimonas sp. TaxID=1871086 RepID=UPI00273548A0|nr:hypothetical protein [Brevundimonas sp.]MDP3406116.1 hypothetical protein [Brevundimonas sp.]